MLRVLLTCMIFAALLAPITPIHDIAQADIVQAKVKHRALPKGRVRKLILPPVAGARSGRGYRRQAFRWFWGEVSTSVAAASRDRWSQVLEVIETGRTNGRPVYGSKDMARHILNTYKEFLLTEARRRNVSLPLLIAVIAVESNGIPTARSPKGAGGLMQLMPNTALRFGVSNRFLPSQNIRGGAEYLDWLLRRFKGDAVLALAGYNAGEGAVDRYSGVPPYAETRDYVAMVAGAYAAARTLCATPPQSPRGACALK